MKDDKYIACAYGGILLINLLTVIFIILKLSNVIDWAWGWIFSPIWISYLLVLIATFIYFRFM